MLDKREKNAGAEGEFELRHYAGSVTYAVAGFVEKNRDSLAPEVTRLLRNSTQKALAESAAARAALGDAHSPCAKRTDTRQQSHATGPALAPQSALAAFFLFVE